MWKPSVMSSRNFPVSFLAVRGENRARLSDIAGAVGDGPVFDRVNMRGENFVSSVFPECRQASGGEGTDHRSGRLRRLRYFCRKRLSAASRTGDDHFPQVIILGRTLRAGVLQPMV